MESRKDVDWSSTIDFRSTPDNRVVWDHSCQWRTQVKSTASNVCTSECSSPNTMGSVQSMANSHRRTCMREGYRSWPCLCTLFRWYSRNPAFDRAESIRERFVRKGMSVSTRWDKYWSRMASMSTRTNRMNCLSIDCWRCGSVGSWYFSECNRQDYSQSLVWWWHSSEYQQKIRSMIVQGNRRCL